LMNEATHCERVKQQRSTWQICIKCLAIGIWFWRPIILVQVM
jgi:hypothetical protein